MASESRGILDFSACPSGQLNTPFQSCSSDQRFIFAPAHRLLCGPVTALLAIVSKPLPVDLSERNSIGGLVMRAAYLRSVLILGWCFRFHFRPAAKLGGKQALLAETFSPLQLHLAVLAGFSLALQMGRCLARAMGENTGNRSEESAGMATTRPCSWSGMRARQTQFAPPVGRIHGDCQRTFAAAMLCASNMSALIPPGCAVM